MKLVNALKKLVNKRVIVELKNGSVASGVVAGVDAYMNIHMHSLTLTVKGRNAVKVKSLSIRGQSIRFIILDDSTNLDALLIDDTPKQRPPRPETGGASRGRGRGRGGGRGSGGGGRGRGRGGPRF